MGKFDNIPIKGSVESTLTTQPTIQQIPEAQPEVVPTSKFANIPTYNKYQQPIKSTMEVEQKKPGILKSIGGALISAEKGLAESVGQSAGYLTGIGKQLDENQKKLLKTGDSFAKLAEETSDKIRKKNLIKQAQESYRLAGTSYEEVLPAIKKTTGQILGEAGGVALDVATAGTFGVATKSAKAGQLLTKSPKLANVAERVGVGVTKPLLTKTPIPSTLQQIKTGAGIGYGYDVATGLQEGETGLEAFKPGVGTLVGGAAPAVFKGIGTGIGKAKQLTPELSRVRLGENLNKVFENSPQSVKKIFNYGKERGIDIGEELSRKGIMPKVENERLVFGQEFITKLDNEIESNSKLIDDLIAQYPDTIIPVNDLRKTISNSIKNNKFLAQEGRIAEVTKKANNIIDNFYSQKGRNFLYLDEIQDFKKGMWRASKKFKISEVGKSDAYSEVGTALMKVVEDEIPDAVAKGINKEIGKAEELYKLLNKINSLQGGGIVLKGGKMGKYVGNITGYTGGLVVGGLLGGAPGVVLGGLSASKLSSVIRNLTQKSAILGTLDRILIRFAKEAPKNIDVKAAQKFIEAVKMGKKPAVTPRVIKAIESANKWAEKNYGVGDKIALPPGSKTTPKGTIELPRISETTRQKQIKASGLINRPPKTQPNVPAPDRKLLPEKATPEKIIPPYTQIEKPAQKIGQTKVFKAPVVGKTTVTGNWSKLQKENPDLFNKGILRKSYKPMDAVGEIPKDVHELQGKWQNYGQNSEIPADVVYKRIESGAFKGEYEDALGNAVRNKNGDILEDIYDDATGEWIKPQISNQELKNSLLEQFRTPEGKKYLNKVIDALPKNSDGSITAYRIGKIGNKNKDAQSYTLSEGMAKTFSHQGTDIPLPGTPGLPPKGYKDFGVLPANMVKIDPKGIKAWSPYDAEILVEPKFVKNIKDSIKRPPTSKKPMIIDADLFKKQANDFDPANHGIYSQKAKEAYIKALKTNTNPVVKFTAGGTGSGKSEIMLPNMSKGFNGIIADTTFSSFKTASKKIDQAISAGKKVEINAILPRLNSAWKFSQIRGIETGRKVPLEVFAEKHTGFVDTLKKVIKEYPEVDVNLLDTRNVFSKTQADNLVPISDKKKILSLLSKIRYNENSIKNNLKNVKTSKLAYTDFKKNIDKVVANVEKDSGLTYNVIKNKNQGGSKLTAVSVYPERSKIIKVDGVDKKVINNYVKKNIDLLKKKNHSLGVWHDKETNEIWLDVVGVVADEKKAIKLGEQFNQKAVFNLERFEEINTKGTGEIKKGFPNIRERINLLTNNI